MIPNGCLIFEDDSFLDSTVAKMNALRKSGQFCDVRLQVCGHELMAHRAVLACCSPYLFEIFNSDMEPHGVAHVKFEDLNPEAVEVLLNYAYTAQLKAEKELVRDVYSAAKRLKMERVKQICGDYLLSKMDCQCAIPYRNFASRMGDGRLVGKIDGYIQEHLLEISEQDDFLKLPRLKLEVILEDNLSLPSNGKLYSKVIYWLQRCLWENGEPLERMMEEIFQKMMNQPCVTVEEYMRMFIAERPSNMLELEKNCTRFPAAQDQSPPNAGGAVIKVVFVQTLYYSADHKLHDGSQLEGQTEVFGNDDHIQFLQKKPLRENFQKQASTSSSGSLSPGSVTQLCKHEWKYIASEKTNNNTYLCLAVLNGVLSVIFLHGRGSPHSSPSSTPSLPKSMSFEGQLEEPEERLRAPMHYARSGLGTAELDGSLVAAGGYNREECLRTVECYDPKTDRWTFIAPMRTPRARFQMAVLMGQLYVMGGSNGHSDELSCGETYNPHEDEWTPVPELRTNRCNAGVCSLNNKLFVVGGSDPCGQKGLKNCDAFDPVTKIWTSCAPLNIRRHQAAACELNSMMYVIGGAESWNCLNSVERYNPENDTWTLIAPMNVARRGAGVAVYQGRLLVAGGFDGSHALRCVEAYDPARNEWKMLGSMTSARSNCGVAVLDGAVYAVGGFDGNDFLSSIETYEPQDDNWSPCMEANGTSSS